LSKFKAWILLTSFWCLWHLIIWVYETRLLTARAAQRILVVYTWTGLLLSPSDDSASGLCYTSTTSLVKKFYIILFLSPLLSSWKFLMAPVFHFFSSFVCDNGDWTQGLMLIGKYSTTWTMPLQPFKPLFCFRDSVSLPLPRLAWN
jgi:hypothetical protein